MIYIDHDIYIYDPPPQFVERVNKKISAIFRKHDLDITIEANNKCLEFLDIYLDLDKEEFGPYINPMTTLFMWTQEVSIHPKF